MKLKGLRALHDIRERDRFEAGLARDAREISDDELHSLLELEWRARITAVWLIGLDRRTQFRDKLAELLFSDGIFPDWAHFFALARFGELADAKVLVDYMENESPLLSRRAYTKAYAFDALCALDDRLGTVHSRQFLDRSFAPEVSRFPEFERPITQFCALADRIMALSSDGGLRP